jgi:hypothetical protein
MIALHRCTVCDTRWILWPDPTGKLWPMWNLLDRLQKPGSCCDNAPSGGLMEHLRDLPFMATAPVALEFQAETDAADLIERLAALLKYADMSSAFWRKRALKAESALALDSRGNPRLAADLQVVEEGQIVIGQGPGPVIGQVPQNEP